MEKTLLLKNTTLKQFGDVIEDYLRQRDWSLHTNHGSYVFEPKRYDKRLAIQQTLIDFEGKTLFKGPLLTFLSVSVTSAKILIRVEGWDGGPEPLMNFVQDLLGHIPAVYGSDYSEPPVSAIEDGDSIRPAQHYSCFISHSSKDQAFAGQLHADLQAKGVQCWFAPEDMRIGDRLRSTLDKSIWKHDKLLIVLSKDSIGSDWVEQEVETALARERQEERIVLFPIRLDDAVMEIDAGWPALIRNTRHIGDFRNWKDHDAYQQAFGRLLRDLKAEDENTDSSDGRIGGADR